MFSCNLPTLHFWQNDRDFFTCYCGNTGVERGYRNKSQHRKSTLEKKNSPRRSSRDSNPRPFNHESGALTTELSPPPPPHVSCCLPPFVCLDSPPLPSPQPFLWFISNPDPGFLHSPAPPPPPPTIHPPHLFFVVLFFFSALPPSLSLHHKEHDTKRCPSCYKPPTNLYSNKLLLRVCIYYFLSRVIK